MCFLVWGYIINKIWSWLINLCNYIGFFCKVINVKIYMWVLFRVWRNIVSNVGENIWILLVLVCMVIMFYLDMRWYN